MKEKEHYMYCVEHLTAFSWASCVYPYILEKVREMGSGQRVDCRIYYIKASKAGLLLARLTLSSINATLEPLDFSLVTLKDENGDLIWWKALCGDSMLIQTYIKDLPEFQAINKLCQDHNRISQFVLRHIMYSDLANFRVRIFTDMLLLVRIMASSYYFKEGCLGNTIFFSSQVPWQGQVEKFAVKQDVKIVALRVIDFDLKKFILRFGHIRRLMKRILYSLMVIRYRVRPWLAPKALSGNQTLPGKHKSSASLGSLDFKMAVEYYGQLNLNSPELNSDVFFYHQSKVSPKDILIYFQHAVFPATEDKWQEISSCGMSAIAIDPAAALTPQIPLSTQKKYNQLLNSRDLEIMQGNGNQIISKNLKRLVKDYYKKYGYWMGFIIKNKIKMHVSWYKHDAKEYALWDALQNSGGVGVIYQRSFEGTPDPWTISSPDVMFGFSKLGAQIGKDTESVIPYYVITGYLGEYRFPLVKKSANSIRAQLLNCGAKKIIAYFDENSVNDARWNLGHHATRENYAYLLSKVLELPWLGLVLKPKIVSDLRQRLGDVASLLDQALETGRCFIFDQGHILGSHPPATAALASDIAIHGHFFSATAGMESALTGTKTLLLDREGCSMSPLYKLGLGKVIFKGWDDLWNASQEYWKSPETMPGFGDWSPVMDDIDPFRDGRAAERMATYLQWLMEGLKAGHDREKVLAQAAERYVKIWGRDKIISVNCSLKEQEYSFTT